MDLQNSPAPHLEQVLDGGTPPHAGPLLDIAIPVYNEERDLERSVRAVHAFLSTQFPYSARITIVDNASTDSTLAVARRLATELDSVNVLHLDAKGRGRALHTAWLGSDAAVLAYMDVDLSTDLSALLPLVAPLVSGHSHVAIGTRLARGSRIVRGPKREIISRGYNWLLRRTLATRFSDAQCGFKAVRSDVARQLLPLVSDTQWFFDTEMLVLAERAGLRIHEVPVDWVDDPESRVDIMATVVADLRGIARLGRDLVRGRLPLAEVRAHLPGAIWVNGSEGRTSDAPLEPGRALLLHQLVRFGLVGVASTAVYVLLYVLLAEVVGAQPANFIALVLTALANTAANRRLTFGVRGPSNLVVHHGQGLVVFVLAWILTAGSLGLLHAAAPGSGRAIELAVLVAANLVATVLRFTLLRVWVFRTPAAVSPAGHAPQFPAADAVEGTNTATLERNHS